MDKNEPDKLSTKVELISTKGLSRDLMNKYRILNGLKYFIEDGSQNCFAFQTSLKYFQASKTAVMA